jgi:hypothetical protein
VPRAIPRSVTPPFDKLRDRPPATPPFDDLRDRPPVTEPVEVPHCIEHNSFDRDIVRSPTPEIRGSSATPDEDRRSYERRKLDGSRERRASY